MSSGTTTLRYAAGLITVLGCLPALAQEAAQDATEQTRQEAIQNVRGKPVGQAPESQDERPQVQAAAEYGGVLTPKGRLILEPEFQYAHESINRVTFEGISILETLLIGVFTAQDVDRDSYTASLTGRLGFTDRLELEMKVPYVYRDESQNVTVPLEDGGEDFNIERDISGNSLGDIELAAHYQLNRGQNGMPFFIGNLRYKTTTGEGPFDVKRNSDGIQQELSTGTGFHSIEPSLTILFPSAPAVYFANLGYLFNLKDDINESTGDFVIGEVDPGDAIRFSFGMAYSINPKTSFTLGYKNDFIGETSTEYSDPDTGQSSTQKSNTLNVGSLLLGWNYSINQDVNVNLGLELGVTEDAPDTTLTLRMPFGMNVF